MNGVHLKPIVAISLLSLIHSVEYAIILISIPLIATNLKMALSGQGLLQRISTSKYLIVSVILGTVIGVYSLSYVNKNLAQIALGIIVIVLIIFNLLDVSFNKIQNNTFSNIVISFFAGLIGGITSAFGPLLATQLKSIKMDSEQFVSTLCLLILSGAITLSISLGAFNLYTGDYVLHSFAACIPTFIGLWLGSLIRNSINIVFFYRLVSFAVIVASINLIYAGWNGLIGSL